MKSFLQYLRILDFDVHFFHINNKGWKVDERAYWNTEYDLPTARQIESKESRLGFIFRSCGWRQDSIEQILKRAEMTGIGFSDRNGKKIPTEWFLSSYSSPRSAEVVVKKDSIILGPKQQRSSFAGRYENVTLDDVKKVYKKCIKVSKSI